MLLNETLGERREIDGGTHLLVRRGRHGHALYGPYELREPGCYTVEFSLSPVEGERYDVEGVCGFIDVTANSGQRLIAHDVVWTSSLRSGEVRLNLSFTIDEPLDLEYRVYLNGTAAAVVEDRATVSVAAGLNVKSGREPFLEIDGLRIRSASYDDIHFVDEIFYKKTYNLVSAVDTCFLDIGMNVGLASLLFAKMPNVREVHAFEPFPDTYARALRNLQLNPDLANKVTAYPFGLAARDEELVVQVEEGVANSGGWNLRSEHGDRTVRLDVRDAASVLGPIISNANASGRQVIAKIDCEGSEFDIFESLSRAGLFGAITALLVEWHRVFEGRDQRELIAPLSRAGFIVIDISPDDGNGFFYAVRSALSPFARGLIGTNESG